MNQTHKLTNADPDQITRYSFDEDHNAVRVIMVNEEPNTFIGGGSVTYTQSEPKIIEIEKPIIIKQIEYKEVQVPYIVEKIEYKEIEKPVYIKEIEYKEVEKQVIIEKIIYKEIDKPIIIEKDKFLSIPKEIKIFIVMHTLFSLGLLVKLFLK